MIVRYTTRSSVWTVDTKANTAKREPIESSDHPNVPYSEEPYTFTEAVLPEGPGGRILLAGKGVPCGSILSGTVLSGPEVVQ